MERLKCFVYFAYLICAFLLTGAMSTADEEPEVVPVSYRDFQVVRILVPSADDERIVKDFVLAYGREDSGQGFNEEGMELQILSSRNGTLDVLCSPDAKAHLVNFLNQRDIRFQVLIDDLQEAIRLENPLPTIEESTELESRGGHRLSWRRYHRFKDIESYIDYLAFTYKEICETVIIGTSTEGRPLKVLKVSSGGDNKPAIWIDGGLHGREWISPATVTYILLQLVEFREKHPHLLENLDWYILPVANPDGYEYSHVHDRLWRKTRSIPVGSRRRHPNPSLGLWNEATPYSMRSQCVGVDANRNWDFQWKKIGASSNPCDDNYAGTKPFSEPETFAIADFIMKHKGDIKLFLSLHSYSQMWLIPWGWTDDEKPADYYDMYVLAEKGVEALEAVRGTDYLLGTAAELIYASSGASDDWAKGVAGIKYAYTIELPDTGTHGFILPASQIEATGQETWAGVKALAQHFADGHN